MPDSNYSSPVFIVGNSRSGTTVLSMGLGNHSDIYSFRELHFFEKYWSTDWNKKYGTVDVAVSVLQRLICGQREGFLYCKDSSVYSKEALQILNNADVSDKIRIEDVYSKFLYNESEINGKSIPCEQTPHNIFYLENIFMFFPNAKVITMVRDPRDILMSQKKKASIKKTGKGNVPLKERVRTWANYHPYIMSKMWNRVAVEIQKWNDDERVKVIKFENLVTSPEAELSDICEFIGVEFQESVLNVPQIGSSNVSDVAENVGLNKNVLNKWKKGLGSSEILVCQNINKQEMDAYGYKLTNLRTNYFTMLLLFLLLPVKAILAILLNIGRSKNILRSIIKRLIK